MSHKSQIELSQMLTQAADQVEVGAQYNHYKNQIYTVLNLAIQESTDAVCVIYRAEYGDKLLFIRPVDEWIEEVEWEGKRVARFTRRGTQK